VATDFSSTMRFPANLATVWAMLRSESYLQAKCADSSDPTYSVIDQPQGCTITVQRTLTEDLPAIAKNLVGDHVTLLEVQSWATDINGITGDFTICVPNAPITVTAVAQLRAEEDSCVMNITGTISVAVPLFSGIAESFMREQMTEVLAREHAIGMTWLAEHS